MESWSWKKTKDFKLHLKYPYYNKCIEKGVCLSTAVHFYNANIALRKLQRDGHKAIPGNIEKIQTQKAKSLLKQVCDQQFLGAFMRDSMENITTTEHVTS